MWCRSLFQSFEAVIASLELKKDGAVRLDRAALSLLPEIEAAVAHLSSGKAGIRIFDNPVLARLLHLEGDIGNSLKPYIRAGAKPVRAILFDKSGSVNWALGWHQDRTIAVTQRIDTFGFSPWTRKNAVVHVEPPFEMIESMITVRIHLDKVCDKNAPLLIAVGSHRIGKIAVDNIERAVDASQVVECTAERGDIWIYATPILHASAKSEVNAHRRVLQVDYADFDLPNGLAWCGI